MLFLIPLILFIGVGCNSEEHSAYFTDLNEITLDLSQQIQALNKLEEKEPVDEKWFADMEVVVKKVNENADRALNLKAPEEKFNNVDNLVKESMNLMKTGINTYFEGKKENNIDKQIEGARLLKEGAEKSKEYATAVNKLKRRGFYSSSF